MKQSNNITIFFSLLLSFLGFLDATYLTILHYKNVIPPCSIAHGCETVLTSKFATIGSVPIALIGVVFYLVVLGVLGMLLQSKNDLKFKKEDLRIDKNTPKSLILNLKSLYFILLALCSAGLVISLILVGIQAFVLHAFCQWCLTSEGINILLFLATLRIYTRKAQ